jgi:F-type H+-transporting ATPase subunit delta
MKGDARVGRRYARALFGTALKYDVVKSVEDDLAGIVGLLHNDRQFRDFVMSPYRSREEKIAVAEKLFSDRVTALTMQLLRLVLEKRRELEIETIRAEFVRLRREHYRIVYATITSAEEMPAEQRERLVARVQALTGKTLEPEFRIDPHLMGGVRVAYDDYVLDGSVRGALNRLQERLKYDLLKQT